MLDMILVVDTIGSFQETLVCYIIYNYTILYSLMCILTEEGKLSATSRSRRPKDEPTDNQRKRVDGLLVDLIKHFPPKVVQPKVVPKYIYISFDNILCILCRKELDLLVSKNDLLIAHLHSYEN